MSQVRRYVRLHGMRHPVGLDGRHVAAFLTHFTVEGKVGASTQARAAGARLFLYRGVLRLPIDGLGCQPCHAPRRLAVVLANGEVAAVLSELLGGE